MKANNKTKNRKYGRYHGQGVQGQELNAIIKLSNRVSSLQVDLTNSERIPQQINERILTFHKLYKHKGDKKLNMQQHIARGRKAFRTLLTAHNHGAIDLGTFYKDVATLVRQTQEYNPNKQSNGSLRLQMLFKGLYAIKTFREKQMKKMAEEADLRRMMSDVE